MVTSYDWLPSAREGIFRPQAPVNYMGHDIDNIHVLSLTSHPLIRQDIDKLAGSIGLIPGRCGQ